VSAQELAARRTMSLDLALRYSPAFMRRGLTIEGEECVFINGQIAGGMRLKDFSGRRGDGGGVRHWRRERGDVSGPGA
jgi:hypothetical protein